MDCDQDRQIAERAITETLIYTFFLHLGQYILYIEEAFRKYDP